MRLRDVVISRLVPFLVLRVQVQNVWQKRNETGATILEVSVTFDTVCRTHAHGVEQ